MATDSSALEAARKKRTALRRSFTTAAKKLENAMQCLESEPETLDKLVAFYRLTQEKAEGLASCDALVYERLEALDADDDSIDRELEEVDGYKVRWLELQSRYQYITRENDNRSVSSDKTVQNKGQKSRIDKDNHFRYPQLEFVKFNGDPHNWLNFWGQFCHIDNDKSLDDYKKFQYLIQATELGSRARDLINSFPPSSENYKIALEHLKERFGKEELIIEVYVRDLLSLVLTQINGSETHSLCELYDKLTTQIRALESLGVTSDKYAAMLYPMVESALPSDILQAFERIRCAKGNRLTQILEFLRREVESIQRIEIARESFLSKEDFNCIKTTDCNATAATLVSSEGSPNVKKLTCVFCDKSNHKSNDCSRLQQLSLEERKEILKKKNVCPICLRPGHHPRFCRSTVKCFICKNRHNTVMCNEVNDKHQEPTEIKEDSREGQMFENKSASVTMSVSNENSIMTYLPTLVVRIRHGDKLVKVRALIDNASQRSYITKDVANQLGLSSGKTETLSHSVFGGFATNGRLHKRYSIIVGSLDSKFNICMSVLDEERICGLLSRIDSKEAQSQFSQHNIEFTDKGASTEIGVLIGADYAGLLMTGEFIQLGDLTATKTKLGWTVQGSRSCLRPTHTLLNLVDVDKRKSTLRSIRKEKDSMNLIPERDGGIRASAKVRINGAESLHPMQKRYPLELKCHEV